MPLPEYPAALPSPLQGYRFGPQPRTRRAPAELGGLDQARAFAREPLHDAEIAWRMNLAQMKAWQTWWRDDLAHGMRWFVMKLPGRGGYLPRAVRFTGPPQYTHLGNGIWDVNVQAQVRASGTAVNAVEYTIGVVACSTLANLNYDVDFSELNPGNFPGINYDTVITVSGVMFGERFAGQGLTSAQPEEDGAHHDVLDAQADGPLEVVAGAPGHNLACMGLGYPRPPLCGLGPELEWPAADSIGEGSIAALFSADQSEICLTLVGFDDGYAVCHFFTRGGDLIGAATVVPDDQHMSGSFGSIGFHASAPVIAGFTIHNFDPAGIAIYSIQHDVESAF